MDPYRESLNRVDAALARLNATLAAYSLEAKYTKANVTSITAAGASLSGNTPTAPPAPNAGPRFIGQHTLGLREQPPPAQSRAWAEVLGIRCTKSIPQIIPKQYESALGLIAEIHVLIDSGREEYTHCLPLFILLAQTYLRLGYPDLAVGESYKALLLSDALQDAGEDIFAPAFDAFLNVILQHPLVERIQLLKNELNADIESGEWDLGVGDEEVDVEIGVWLRKHYLPLIYRYLVRSLFLCGCYKSAHQYAGQGLRLYPKDAELGLLRTEIQQIVVKELGHPSYEAMRAHPEHSSPTNWPDKGLVRREVYPWNTLEPDRLKELAKLNSMMAEVAPKLEVRAVELPALTGQTSSDGKPTVSVQLGVFAKEDIAPGEVVLSEKSMLTANNRLQDALCDACSADLPDLGKTAGDTVRCPECEIVCCSNDCAKEAVETYHVAQCGTDSEAMLKDVPPEKAADALYSLLLLRALAMAETQGCHPLSLKEVKYIWADFNERPTHYQNGRLPDLSSPSKHIGDPVRAHASAPRTLPFSFEHNVRLPFHMLEKMDIDIFCAPQYSVWVFNTLYAKFRGTASARLSGLGGRAIRGPEVSAVHPMWCLANHSCDPNVSWEWGGKISFWARNERVRWKSGNNARDGDIRSAAGIKKGEEVLNHYCDIDLPVKERREWARGALGGDCMCERCLWEAKQEQDQDANGCKRLD